jgi:alpha-glucosidase
MGFTTGDPWLPLSPHHRELSVSKQGGDPLSTLNFARRFLAARRRNLALRLGEIEFLVSGPPILAYVRSFESERVLCVFNMSASQATCPDFGAIRGVAADLCSGPGGLSNNVLTLGPYAAWFAFL